MAVEVVAGHPGEDRTPRRRVGAAGRAARAGRTRSRASATDSLRASDPRRRAGCGPGCRPGAGWGFHWPAGRRPAGSRSWTCRWCPSPERRGRGSSRAAAPPPGCRCRLSVGLRAGQQRVIPGWDGGVDHGQVDAVEEVRGLRSPSRHSISPESAESLQLRHLSAARSAEPRRGPRSARASRGAAGTAPLRGRPRTSPAPE